MTFHARERGRLIAAAVSLALLVAALAPGLAQARPLVTGLSGPDQYSPLALQQAKATGIRLIRISLPWSAVAPHERPASWEPTNPADPNYDWTSADAAIKGASEAGLVPVVGIEGAPGWAQRPCRRASPTLLCAPEAAALAEFATAAATRYGGSFEGLPRVHYWQALNEPNLSLYFNPQFEHGAVVSAQNYRKLINAFYAAVKAVNGSNVVIAAGLGPIAVKKLTVGPMQFARLLLCMRGRKNPRPTGGNCEGGVHFDVLDVHPYTTGGPRRKGGPDDVELGDLGKMQELVRAADRAGRIKGSGRTQIWATEFSWDTKPPDPGGLPMRIATRWTAEALHQAWLAGITRFFWFSLRDFPREGQKSSEVYESGLYFRGATVAKDRPKPLMYAFRFPFVAYSVKRGFTFWGRTPTSSGGAVAIEVFERGRWRRAFTARAAGNGIFQGRVRTSYGEGKRGKVRATYRGESAPVFSLTPVKEFYQPPFGR